MNITVEGAAQLLGAKVAGPKDRTISSVSTDSRTLASGSCFVALKGEFLDGHVYIPQAVERGATVVIVDHVLDECPVTQLVVKDTLTALGDLAADWRSRFALPVAVLTGSSGKTTTKEMAATIVGSTRPTLVTHGNLNNLIGLPQMMFQLTGDHEAAILELGMNTAGELKRLTEISAPTCVACTNITNAHIGMFGSEELLYQAKADAFRHSSDDAVLILNSDDRLSIRLREEFTRGRSVISFGFAPGATVSAQAIEAVPPFGYRFQLAVEEEAPQPVELRVFGRHNIMNALAAAAIGRYFGVAAARIAEGLSAFQPKANRSEVEELNGWFVIKDYYNASPAAVEQALLGLGDVHVPGKRYAILADMLELGDMEEHFHRHIGVVASTSSLARLFTLGDRGRMISDAAAARGTPVEHLSDVEAAAEQIRRHLQPGDLILIKGSRLMKLERIYEILKGASRSPR